MAIGRLPEPGGDGEDAILAEINITPLTDIFLVLLIIFMITSTALVEAGPRVRLPEAKETSAESQGVVITVEANGRMALDGRELAPADLSAALAEAVAKSPSKRVVLEGDRGVVLGEVVNILDEARRAGATEVAIAAERGAAPAGGG